MKCKPALSFQAARLTMSARGRVVPAPDGLGEAQQGIAMPPAQGMVAQDVVVPGVPIVVQPSAECIPTATAVQVAPPRDPVAWAVHSPGEPVHGGVCAPVMGQPVMGQPVMGPGVVGRWLSDPFDAWCSSAPTCLQSTCCICYPLSDAAGSVGLDKRFVWHVSCALWTVHMMTEGPVVCWYFPWCFCLKMGAMMGNASLISNTRAKFAERDQIPVNSCDLGFSFCCGPCAVSQMTIHNLRRFSREGPR